MKVTTSFGYVEIKDYITRKADNIYTSILFAHMNAQKLMPVAKKTLNKEIDQEEVEKEAGSLVNPMQLIEAAQARAYEMIDRIVKVKEDKTEEELEKNQKWWDDCDRNDAKAIQEAVELVNKEKEEEAKKQLGTQRHFIGQVVPDTYPTNFQILS